MFRKSFYRLVLISLVSLFGFHVPETAADNINEEDVTAELKHYDLRLFNTVYSDPKMVVAEAHKRDGRLAVVVLHIPGSDDNPADYLVIAGDPVYKQFLETEYTKFLEKSRIEVDKLRRVGTILYVEMHHVVFGARIPQDPGKLTTIQIGNFKIHVKPDGSGGLTSEVTAERIAPGGMTAGKRSNALVVVEQRKKSESQERAKKRDAKAQERVSQQRTIYADATTKGTVYKGFDFWVYFENPMLMESVFNGGGSGQDLDGILLAWVSAFEAQCSHLLVDDYHEFEDQTLVTVRNGLGVVRSQHIETDRVRVRSHFAPFVLNARYSANPSGMTAALEHLGRIQSGDFSGIFEVPTQIRSPIVDAGTFIALSGCDSNAVRQFDMNLLAALGGGRTAQEFNDFDRPKSLSESSPEPTGKDFSSMSEACWHDAIYETSTLKPYLPQLCVCEEKAIGNRLSATLKKEAMFNYPEFRRMLREAKTPELYELRKASYQACKQLLE